jgi:branched-chain amino acid transport system substrate-binding protein
MRRCRCLSLLVSLLMAGCSSKAASEPVWIGHLLPLEGVNRTLGEHAQQGVELAVAEARDAEQTAGGRPCAVLHVDSRDDADTVRAETVRLLTVNKAVALLADFDAASTEAMIRASRSYGAAVVVPGELPAPSDSDAVLSLSIPPAVRGRALARYAATELKCRRAAVLTDSRRPIAASLASAFRQAWPRGGEGGVEEWTFTTAAERDEGLAALLKTAPNVVMLACSVADFRLLRPRLAEALPKSPLLYGGEDASAAALQAELEKRADVYLATAYSSEHLTESGRAFAKRYQDRFHQSPDLYAAQSYDAARLLLESLQRTGAPSREAVVNDLAHREQFESVTGPVRWKERQPRRRVFLVGLTGNQAKLVSLVEPEEN